MTSFDIAGNRPLIISGPCSAETEQQTMTTCREIAATGLVDMLRAGIWKPRTSPGCFEGVGEVGLEWMAKAKAETGLPFAIEVATAKHVETALRFGVDMVWIGARTTVSPFSVQEIAEALRGVDIPVFVKNPMHADLALWAGAAQRLQAVGLNQIGLIHRGFSHYGVSKYRNHPLWHLAIDMRLRMPELPMICDPSHITGNRDMFLEVSQEAANLNYDGLMIESHCSPAQAWSDASQQITPNDLERLLRSVKWRNETIDRPEFQQALYNLRSQIDQYDSELFMLLSKRMKISEQIGEIKRDHNVTILQSIRWDDIVNRVLDNSDELGLSREFLRTLLNAIHMESIAHQNIIMSEKQ